MSLKVSGEDCSEDLALVVLAVDASKSGSRCLLLEEGDPVSSVGGGVVISDSASLCESGQRQSMDPTAETPPY